jgi:hypothetical protein
VLAGLGVLVDLVLPRAVILALVGALIAAYALGDLIAKPVRRPNSSWQVPEGLRRTKYVGSMALIWGVLLGTGWLTANITSALMVTSLAALTVSPVAAVLAGVVFGLAQAMTLGLSLGTLDYETVMNRYARLATRMRLARAMTVLASACILVSLSQALT